MAGELVLIAALTKTIILGDSLSQGMSWYYGADYADTRPGRTSFEKWEVNLPRIDKSTTVIVILGTNDVNPLNAYGEKTYRPRIEGLARELSHKAGKVVWVGPPCSFQPWWEANLKKVERIQQEVFEQAKLPNLQYLSMRDFTAPNGVCQRSGRAPDGIHFTIPNGYAALGEYVKTHIR